MKKRATVDRPRVSRAFPPVVVVVAMVWSWAMEADAVVAAVEVRNLCGQGVNLVLHAPQKRIVQWIAEQAHPEGGYFGLGSFEQDTGTGGFPLVRNRRRQPDPHRAVPMQHNLVPSVGEREVRAAFSFQP